MARCNSCSFLVLGVLNECQKMIEFCKEENVAIIPWIVANHFRQHFLFKHVEDRTFEYCPIIHPEKLQGELKKVGVKKKDEEKEAA